MKNIVILISGRGSNMQALLNAKLSCRFVAVISNRADAPGLAIAKHHGIPTSVISHKDFAERADFDATLAACIDSYQPDLIVLAGFMRILSPKFVRHYRGRLINIHPSLLPAYSGLNTHARALKDGVRIHGCTVHFVTSDLDHGPIIIQAAVPVLPSDTVATLSARVLQQEHRIYAQAVHWFCSGYLSLTPPCDKSGTDDKSGHGKVILNRVKQPGCALISPGLY